VGAGDSDHRRQHRRQNCDSCQDSHGSPHFSSVSATITPHLLSHGRRRFV